MAQLSIKVGVRWWLAPSVRIALAFNRLTGWTPSESTIKAWAKRAVYVVQK